MRNRWSTLLACCLILTAGCVAACNTVGNTARDAVSAPVLKLVDDTIAQHARIGAAGQADVLATIDSFQQAVGDGDIEGVYLLWPQVEQAALAGIASRQAAGELGPGPADSKRETVARFGSLLTRHVTRLGGIDTP